MDIAGQGGLRVSAAAVCQAAADVPPAPGRAGGGDALRPPAGGDNTFPLQALASEPFIRLEEGDDYEITAALDRMDVRPNVRYTAREDRTMLAMVSKGLGISLLPELMVRHSPYPVTACRPPMTFHRSIGIGVKDEKALSSSTRRFVDYVRRWVAENGDQ